MKFKKVMRYQQDIKRLRMFRVIFAGGRKAISFSLEPKLFLYENMKWPNDTIVTIAGLRFHYKKAGGGFIT